MNRIADGRATADFFDAVARDYDVEFVQSQLGRDLRGIVWNRLEANFKAGDRVLELNCGTGEDAVWMAKRGVRVVATDISDEMLKSTARKAAAGGVEAMIEVRHLDIASPGLMSPGLRFDGVLSNFGGLNCACDLRPLASMLAEHVVRGGILVLVLMGRHCAWEMAWHCLHLEPATAFRRLSRDGAEARAGLRVIRVWYPSGGSVRRALAPWFELRRALGLGVFLPPSYLASVIAGRPVLRRFLGRLELSLAARFPFRRFGDHILLEFKRTGVAFRHGQ